MTVRARQVHAKILSADWSPDGLHLALGFFDGHVGIRDVEGVEKISITRWVVNDGRSEQLYLFRCCGVYT